jgi:predicted GNAT family acetyltransferase
MAETAAKSFTHEPDASRYAMRLGERLLCVVDYAVNGNSISLTRTYTQPAERGRGYAAELVGFAVDEIEASSSRRIVPMCWYVGEWFEKHPERASLLTR